MADYARGARLRELREARHESQETIAYEIGVSTKTLRAWEHGSKIRWENAKRLARYYRVDAEELVSRETPVAEQNGHMPPSQLDRIEAMLSAIYELLTAPASTRTRPRLPAPTGALGRSLSDDQTKSPDRRKTPSRRAAARN